MLRMEKSGFTLLETLVSATILITTLVGFITLAALSLQTYQTTKQRYIASKIAQEGMELVMNKRDNNVLCVKSGSCSDLSCASGEDWRKGLLDQLGASCNFTDEQWAVDATKPHQLLSANTFDVYGGGTSPICIQSGGTDAGKFKHCEGAETPIPGNYTRRVEIEEMGDERIKVRSIVTWKTRSFTHQVELDSVIFGLP